MEPSDVVSSVKDELTVIGVRVDLIEMNDTDGGNAENTSAIKEAVQALTGIINKLG